MKKNFFMNMNIQIMNLQYFYLMLKNVSIEQSLIVLMNNFISFFNITKLILRTKDLMHYNTPYIKL